MKASPASPPKSVKSQSEASVHQAPQSNSQNAVAEKSGRKRTFEEFNNGSFQNVTVGDISMKSATPVSHQTPRLVQNYAAENSKAKPEPDQQNSMRQSEMLVNDLKNLSLVSNPNERASHSPTPALSDNQSINAAEMDKENIPP